MCKKNNTDDNFELNWYTLSVIKKISSSISEDDIRKKILDDVEYNFDNSLKENNITFAKNLLIILLNYSNCLFFLDTKHKDFLINNHTVYYNKLFKMFSKHEKNFIEFFSIITECFHCEYFYISFVMYLYENVCLKYNMDVFLNRIDNSQRLIITALYSICYYYDGDDIKHSNSSEPLEILYKFNNNIQQFSDNRLPEDFSGIFDLFINIYPHKTPRVKNSIIEKAFSKKFNCNSDNKTRQKQNTDKIQNFIKQRMRWELDFSLETDSFLPIDILIKNACQSN